MFTGIIEELGKIRQVAKNSLIVECNNVLEGTKSGDSIAVNGVCLTVTELFNNAFSADISEETLKVTALSQIKAGDFVNLERAMPATGRFGGHIVSGHIDGTGKCLSSRKNGDFYDFEVELPSGVEKYVVKKGSIAINGISLTVAEINRNIIKLAIIPHTYENTNLKYIKNGEFVNIEVDILSKYIEKFLSSGDNRSGIDENFLVENGFY